MHFFSLRTLLATSLVLSAACGGGTPEPTTASGAGSAAPTDTSAAPADTSATASAVPTTWTDGMSKPQEVAFMKRNVVPAMGPVFQGHDAAKYGNFDCKTCHGPQFQTPKDFLPHLTFTGGKLTAFADKPEMSKFMKEQVNPAMAKAMGEPEYDPATQKGFGCGGCHTIDMK